MNTQTEQEKLIGEHPNSGVFSEWLVHEDLPATPNKKHRKLSEVGTKRLHIIEQLANWIIAHHLAEKKLERLKKKKVILGKHDYKTYLEMQKPLPTADKTKKGNGTEIILAEYLQATSKLNLLVYKLRYNQNVDQSIKGDDVLLLNRTNLYKKVIVGESKFRKTPNKAAVEEILDSLGARIKLPLSLTFVAEMMSVLGEEDLAEKLEDLNAEMHKGNVPVVNVGLIMSNENASAHIERNGDSNNPNLVWISLGLNNPEEVIERSFELAYNQLEDIS